MDIKTAIEHYKNGTATEAERVLAEDALDTFLLLEGLVKEDRTDEVTVNIQKAADPRLIRRRLRKRSFFQVLASILLTFSLLLGILKIGIPAAESLYWQPDDSSFEAESSDLLLVLNTYSNLFCPEIDMRSVKSTHIGYASYDLELEYISEVEYPHSSYGNAVLEKGNLCIPESFWPMVRRDYLHNYASNDFKMEYYTEILSLYPEYINVSAFVCFSEDITMQELLAFKLELSNRIPQNGLTHIGFFWTAIRCYEDTDENYDLPHCGLGTGGYVPAREINLVYPNFDGTQYPGVMSQGIPLASSTQVLIYENQFIAQLSFMRDMCREGRGIGDQAFYENALAYIEENGIRVYGLYVVASPQMLLQLMEMENVSGVFPHKNWVA